MRELIEKVRAGETPRIVLSEAVDPTVEPPAEPVKQAQLADTYFESPELAARFARQGNAALKRVGLEPPRIAGTNYTKGAKLKTDRYSSRPHVELDIAIGAVPLRADPALVDRRYSQLVAEINRALAPVGLVAVAVPTGGLSGHRYFAVQR